MFYFEVQDEQMTVWPNCTILYHYMYLSYQYVCNENSFNFDNATIKYYVRIELYTPQCFATQVGGKLRKF